MTGKYDATESAVLLTPIARGGKKVAATIKYLLNSVVFDSFGVLILKLPPLVSRYLPTLLFSSQTVDGL